MGVWLWAPQSHALECPWAAYDRGLGDVVAMGHIHRKKKNRWLVICLTCAPWNAGCHCCPPLYGVCGPLSFVHLVQPFLKPLRRGLFNICPGFWGSQRMIVRVVSNACVSQLKWLRIENGWTLSCIFLLGDTIFTRHYPVPLLERGGARCLPGAQVNLPLFPDAPPEAEFLASAPLSCFWWAVMWGTEGTCL